MKLKLTKVVKITLDQGENYSNGYVIKAGDILEVEEVKEEKECEHPLMLTCPKCAERVDKYMSNSLGRLEKEMYGASMTETYKNITELGGLPLGLDQQKPLTPKDVVVTRKLAVEIDNFIEWAIEENNFNIHNMSDGKFDELYQQFLTEYKDKLK